MLRSIIIIALSIIAEHGARNLFTDYIEFSYNTGIILGAMRTHPNISLILSVTAALILFCYLIHGLIHEYLTRTQVTGLSILLGGAFSNTLERIFLGHVIDWIPLPFSGIYFNIADVEIALGIFILFVDYINTCLNR